MSRVGVVVNPVGNPEGAHQLVTALESLHDVRVLETTKDDPGTAMAAEFVDDGCVAIVAGGGDGTVRAVAEALVNTDTDLVVLPSGTGNLLALNMGLPDSITDVARLISDGRSERIDVGIANDEVFLIMAGTGLDTTIMEETDRDLKDRIGALAYVMTALTHLRSDPFDISLSVDSTEPERMSVATILVGNMGRILGPLDVFPDSDWTDGRFDVLAVTAESLASWVEAASEAIGREGEHARRFTATEVGIDFDKPRTYQLDGEERPPADSVAIHIAREAVSVRRPR